MAKKIKYISANDAKKQLIELYQDKIIDVNDIRVSGDQFHRELDYKKLNRFLWKIISKMKKHKINFTDCTYRAIVCNGRITEKWKNPACFDSKQQGHRALIVFTNKGIKEIYAYSHPRTKMIMRLELGEPCLDRSVYSIQR
jgi:hypothetical protein